MPRPSFSPSSFSSLSSLLFCLIFSLPSYNLPLLFLFPILSFFLLTFLSLFNSFLFPSYHLLLFLFLFIFLFPCDHRSLPFFITLSFLITSLSRYYQLPTFLSLPSHLPLLSASPSSPFRFASFSLSCDSLFLHNLPFPLSSLHLTLPPFSPPSPFLSFTFSLPFSLPFLVFSPSYTSTHVPTYF